MVRREDRGGYTGEARSADSHEGEWTSVGGGGVVASPGKSWPKDLGVCTRVPLLMRLRLIEE